MTGGIGLVGLGRVGDVRHARVFEGEDKVDGDFGGVEGFGGSMVLVKAGWVRVEVEWCGIEVQRLERKVLSCQSLI